MTRIVSKIFFCFKDTILMFLKPAAVEAIVEAIKKIMVF
jgi:hypothetical protein